MPMTMKRIEYATLAAIVGGYLLLAVLYALNTAAWQAPDEPAHYNTAAQIATDGCCPLIELGDWDSPTLEALKSARFANAPSLTLARIQYEDHQPPAYYLLMAGAFALTGGNLLAMRILSALLGVGVVLAAYATVRVMLPTRAPVALTTAALVAFIPQHLAILGSLNNDALAELIAAVTLWACALYLARPKLDGVPAVLRYGVASAAALIGALALIFSGGVSVGVPLGVVMLAGAGALLWGGLDATWRWHVLLGVLVGGAFVTKSTIYLMAGVVVLAVFLRPLVSAARTPVGRGAGVALKVAGALSKLEMPAFGAEPAPKPLTPARKWRLGWGLLKNGWQIYAPVMRRSLRQTALFAGVVVAVAGVIGAVWWVRNSVAYGFPDVLGLTRHDEVVIGQLRTAERIAQVGWSGYWQGVFATTFNSFWGQFGWMALPLPSWAYPRIGLLLLGAALGLAWDVARVLRGKTSPPSAMQVSVGLLMALMGILALAQFALYNISFYQVQGRYLFVALIPFALWIAAGLDAWARVLADALQARAAAWAGYVRLIPALLIAGSFGAFNLWLVRYILPYLAP